MKTRWWMIPLAAVVAAAALVWVATGRPAVVKEPAYVPNSKAQVQRIIRELEQLSAFGEQYQTGGDGRIYLCRFVDDAPTRKSLKHSAVIYFCVPGAPAAKPAKPKPAS